MDPIGRGELSHLEFTQTVTIVALSVFFRLKSAMASANSIDQILLNLLGPEGCNEWFSDAGDEDVLSVAVPSSSKDSFETETAPLTGSGSVHRKFAEPKTDEEVSQARESAIPAKTRQDTEYCVRMWDQWASFRNGRPGTSNSYVPSLIELANDPPNLQYWLSRFCLEARKKDGSEFPPNSLHHLVCGLMRYIRLHGNPSLDLFKESAYAQFRQTLDSEMKRLQRKGLGSCRKQAEPLTEQEEEILWQKGYLGDHSPQALVTTMIFMCGLYFALRSGAEHRNLRHNPSQITLFEPPDQRAYLRYVEDVSKNNQGGLKSRKNKPKVVYHHANVDDSTRCFVRLYKLYKSLCPDDQPDDAFYLTPLKKPKTGCWFSRTALGHNTLRDTVNRICKEAGIQGFKTNHSLRSTAASRLYQAGVDEQLVMERTGHRSLEGVRSYKRTCDEQRIALSDILNRKKPRQDDLQVSELKPKICQVRGTEESQNALDIQYSAQSAFNFNLTSCGTVNINFHRH